MIDEKRMAELRIEDIGLKPGRELDALVAEKVMGINETLVYEYFDELHSEMNRAVFPAIPHYSTDIAAAWMILEKAYSFYLESDEYEGRKLYNVGLKFGEDGDNHHQQGYSAPHAICLAALKAFGVEV